VLGVQRTFDSVLFCYWI